MDGASSSGGSNRQAAVNKQPQSAILVSHETPGTTQIDTRTYETPMRTEGNDVVGLEKTPRVDVIQGNRLRGHGKEVCFSSPMIVDGVVEVILEESDVSSELAF